MSLFAKAEQENLQRVQPLAARMRPRSLDEFLGQSHILGPAGLLRQLIQADRLGSLILYGPPGTGKTTLAQLLAQATGRRLLTLSAIAAGVKDLREALAEAREQVVTGGPATLLFVDEIHRFNRAQQDALLSDVEQGVVSLVGATTSNPVFAISGALLSRSKVFEFRPLSPEDIARLVDRALADRERGLGGRGLTIDPAAVDLLAALTDGDARQSLATLEIAAELAADGKRRIAPEHIRAAVATRSFQYDVSGTEHFDCASALIKSIRGSDVDAAIYWLARMLASGDEIRFLSRRLVILASEDIGNADPQALPMAVACFTGCEQVGLPEAKYLLAQTVAYLACAPKSNAATRAIQAALQDIAEQRVIPVPRHLQNRPAAPDERNPDAAQYLYAHHAESGIVAQEYLGIDRVYYEPVDRGFESELRERLRFIREQLGKPSPATDQPSS